MHIHIPAGTGTETMDDGWDDEDSLNFDDDDDQNSNACNEEVQTSGGKNSDGPTCENDQEKCVPNDDCAEGWDDDDELNFDDDDNNDPPSAEPPAADLGWEEDDDLFEEMESSELPVSPTIMTTKATTATSSHLKTTEVTPSFQSSQLASSIENSEQQKGFNPDRIAEVDDGWDDFASDTDGDLTEDKPQETFIGAASIGGSSQQHLRQHQSQQQHNKNNSKIYTELENYLLQLPQLQASMNAVLQAEYNVLDKAIELVQYYSDRPALHEYTLDKELPRMDYVLTTPSGAVLNDKQQIADALQRIQSRDPMSLVSRCANQSLLADLLQLFTGADALIRPQFFATAVARYCGFQIHLEQQPELLEVQSVLDVSVPTEQGRWKVAEVSVTIVFVPAQPFVQYRVDNIQVSPEYHNDVQHWKAQLLSAAQMLESLDMGPNNDAVDEHQQEAIGNFRDIFLTESLSQLQSSATGMKSAWQELESVAGFGSKLSKLPSFLPTDVLAAAEQAEAVSTQEQHQQHAAVQQQPPSTRPTSILGGLVRSGLGALAKTVTLPDEDPSMYTEWQEGQQPHTPTGPEPMQLYQREAPVPPPHFPPPEQHQLSLQEQISKQHQQPAHVSSASHPQSTHNAKPRSPLTEELVAVKNTDDVDVPTLQNLAISVEKSPAVIPVEEPVAEDGWDEDEDDFEESEEIVEDKHGCAKDKEGDNFKDAEEIEEEHELPQDHGALPPPTSPFTGGGLMAEGLPVKTTALSNDSKEPLPIENISPTPPAVPLPREKDRSTMLHSKASDAAEQVPAPTTTNSSTHNEDPVSAHPTAKEPDVSPRLATEGAFDPPNAATNDVLETSRIEDVSASYTTEEAPPMEMLPGTFIEDRNWRYNPETDIIPTRKRWVNPIQGSRKLGSIRTRATT